MVYITDTRPRKTSKITSAISKIRLCITAMFITLIVGGIGVAWQSQQLLAILHKNTGYNGFIVVVLVIGIGVVFWQSFHLLRECKWLNAKIQHQHNKHSPSLLASMDIMFDQPIADVADDIKIISIDHSQSMLEGISIRLDAMREIPRYMLGVLVFLGLLGTFWGLLDTISKVGSVVNAINLTGGDFDAAVEQLRSGLTEPLNGMAIAFSSSLFGLGGSLILGFLDLILGQAIGRTYANIEDWLASITLFHGADDKGEHHLKGAIKDARVADAKLQQAIKMAGGDGKTKL